MGLIGFKLVDRDKRECSAKDIASKLREQLERIPGISRMKVTATSQISSLMMGGEKPIVVEIAGPDLNTNLKVAEQVKKIVQEVPGTTDVSLSHKDPRPELWVEVNREKASSFGLNLATIAGTVRTYFYGDNPTEFRDEGDSFDIFIRLSEADKNKLENLPEVPIFTPGGRMIKLNYAFDLTGTTLSLISYMGIIMLVGIVVKNSVILLDYNHLLQNRGQPLLEAITNAGRNRLRPILMTTAAMFFGMLPLAVFRGGSGLRSP